MSSAADRPLRFCGFAEEAPAEMKNRLSFENPHAWLEPDAPEALAWEHERDAEAVTRLRGWKGYEALRAAAAATVAADRFDAPQRHGDRWFTLVADADGTRLTVSDDPVGPVRTLLSSATLGQADAPLSIDYVFPSPDGRHVAFGCSSAGDEQSVLRVCRVEDATVLPGVVLFASWAVVAWLPDGSGFFTSAGNGSDLEDGHKHLLLHRLGDSTPRSFESLTTDGRHDVREPFSLTPQVSPDGRWLAAVTGAMDPRPDYVRALPDGEWRPFLRDLPGSAHGVFADGDAYVAIVFDAPNGRLVRIPLAGGDDPTTWTELVPASHAVLRSVARAGDNLVLSRYWTCSAEIVVLEQDGTLVHEVELPGQGSLVPYGGTLDVAGAQHVHPWDGGFAFVFSSPTRSPAILLHDVEANETRELRAPRVVRDDLVTAHHHAIAPDGAEVHYTTVRRADLDPTVPQPALIHAYGGWNFALVPTWLDVLEPFVDAGGVLVLAHLRGGGEYGQAFWHGGRLAHKQHTFDDLYAVAEALIAGGVTTADRLGLTGASNGGLLGCAAVVQRPELFRAVAALVPIADMMLLDRDPVTVWAMHEYGDPRRPQDARWLYAYSPYHNVRRGPVPATLLHAGASDVRSRPWHARKFAARLAEANDGPHPVLLRVAPGAGHTTARSDPALVAEWLGFLMAELGLAPVAPEPVHR